MLYWLVRKQSSIKTHPCVFILASFAQGELAPRHAGFYGQGAVAAPEAATGAERKLGEEAGAVSGTAEDPVFCRRQKMTPYKKVAPMVKKIPWELFFTT